MDPAAWSRPYTFTRTRPRCQQPTPASAKATAECSTEEGGRADSLLLSLPLELLALIVFKMVDGNKHALRLTCHALRLAVDSSCAGAAATASMR